jgi:hypothetical protein
VGLYDSNFFCDIDCLAADGPFSTHQVAVIFPDLHSDEKNQVSNERVGDSYDGYY